MIIEHFAIAVILGLPFFSLAMIAADAVFLPTSFLRRLGGWAARARARWTGRRSRTTVPAPRAPESAEDTPVGFTT
jgi:predicted DCC family thiol-disulfide oxidoreductase YuxK